MSFNPNKTDPELGARVQQYLIKMQANTPMANIQMSSEKHQMDTIEFHMKEVMKVLGLDLSDDSLMETPKRVAKMYVRELFWGLNPDNFPKCTTVENKMRYNSMVIEKDITAMSACEHHLVTIDGKATIAYIPKDRVLGLSKLNRITEYFARRPQIQERLTDQIYHALCFILDTEDVAVYLDAEHYCVRSRGVEDHGSHTITVKLGGAFLENATTRSEFMSIATK